MVERGGVDPCKPGTESHGRSNVLASRQRAASVVPRLLPGDSTSATFWTLLSLHKKDVESFSRVSEPNVFLRQIPVDLYSASEARAACGDAAPDGELRHLFWRLTNLSMTRGGDDNMMSFVQ